jgi:hypothetical protein
LGVAVTVALRGKKMQRGHTRATKGISREWIANEREYDGCMGHRRSSPFRIELPKNYM